MLPEHDRGRPGERAASNVINGDNHRIRRNADVEGDALGAYIEHFRSRVLQDALAEATAAYWTRRAEAFAGVGTAACDEIARACLNRAAVSLGGDLR